MDNRYTLTRAGELSDELISIRRKIHQNPEIGFDLPETTALVAEKLKAYGIEFKKVGKAGISAVLGNAEAGGKTFLLRADMDALPFEELTGLTFASNNGCMHACGHDIHTSALLGAARILKEREGELRGRVKLMFQPCEEDVGGAADMVEAGVLENPSVDGAMALHVVHHSMGSVGYSTGAACASSDVFTITIHGEGGHGAVPDSCIDPINAAVHIHMAQQALNSRETHPDEMLVLTICEFHSGAAANVFSDTAVMRGTIRTRNQKVREYARRRLEEISSTVASAFGASARVEYLYSGVPPMVNDQELLEEAAGYIDRLLGPGTCYELPRMTGSEDFSVLSQLVPSVLFWVGTGSQEEGYPYGVHNPKVTFSEDMIPVMSAIYAEVAICWLENHPI